MQIQVSVVILPAAEMIATVAPRSSSALTAVLEVPPLPSTRTFFPETEIPLWWTRR